MRTRALVAIALLSLSSGLSAQGIRLPRVGRRTPPQAAPLPPEAPAVSRALAFRRSRWSAEAYSLVSAIQVPTEGGGATSFMTAGTGTHADYRYTDHFSASADLTVSSLLGPANIETAEVGTRYRALSYDQQLQPFFDLRAGFMHMYDTFAMPVGTSVGIGGANQQYAETGRYSRGFGGVIGSGFEYSLSHSFALTTELSAMRSRMSTYRLTRASGIPTGGPYWMTAFRFTLGLRYNATRALHLSQNPTH
jgi:hypothetical protein